MERHYHAARAARLAPPLRPRTPHRYNGPDAPNALFRRNRSQNSYIFGEMTRQQFCFYAD